MSTERDVLKVMGFCCANAWLIFGITQIIIGFVSNGNCDANEELPIYIGVHGLLNTMYGIGLVAFIFGYKLFVVRFVFYLTWIAEGPLCITGIAFYSNTVGYLKGCSKNCKTCSKDLVTGSIVIESFILFMYLVVTFSIIGYEIKTRCKYCKLGDGNRVGGGDTDLQPGSELRLQTRRTDQTTASRGSGIARRTTDQTNERNISGHNFVNIQNMYVSRASQMPVPV